MGAVTSVGKGANNIFMRLAARLMKAADEMAAAEARSAAKGSGKKVPVNDIPRRKRRGPHHMQYQIVRNGKPIGKPRALRSGNMTPEEKALGFPENTFATHTETRAIGDLRDEVRPGDTVVMGGRFESCTRCRGQMNDLYHEMEGTVEIQYHHPGGIWLADGGRR